MQRLRFTKDYDHHWPSGAETAFKAGWSGPVKDEVATAALAKGVAEPSEGSAADDGLSGNIMQLQKIARDEGIDVGEARTVPEYQAAITTGRAAKSPPA
jgi:hypothetical protein